MRGSLTTCVGLALGLACGARSSLRDVPVANDASDASDAACDAIVVGTTAVVVKDEIGAPLIGPWVIGDWLYVVTLVDGAIVPPREFPDRIATIQRLPRAGGSLTALATFGVRQDREPNVQIGFDAKYMYWANDPATGPGELHGSIERALLDGTAQTTVLGGLSQPSGVVVVSGKIYFNVGDTKNQAAIPSFARMNTDGSGIEIIALRDPLSFGPGEFVVTDAYSYETVKTKLVKRAENAASNVFAPFVTLNNDPGLAFTTGESQDATRGFAILTRSVDGGSGGSETLGGVGSVLSWPITGGPVTTLADGFDARVDAEFTATDSTFVYFTTPSSVERIPTSGGASKTVGPSAGFIGGLALDDAHVYWSTWDGTGAVSIYAACK